MPHNEKPNQSTEWAERSKEFKDAFVERDTERLINQIDRLQEQINSYRTNRSGLSHGDASKDINGYVPAKLQLGKLKSELEDYRGKTLSEEDYAHFHKIRGNIALYVNEFRQSAKEFNAESAEGGSEGMPDAEKPEMTNNEFIAQGNLDDRFGYGYDIGETENGIAEVNQENPKESLKEESESDLLEKPAPEVQKAFESRLELRNDWKEKKGLYENEYRKYLEDLENKKKNRGAFEKIQFWKKDKMPAELLEIKSTYQDSKQAYASSLDTALASRFVRRVGGPDTQESLRAGLANRFILRSAHDQLKIEREFVPEGNASKTLEGLKDVFNKHHNKIRYAGLAITVGASVMSGGVFGLATALGQRMLGAKLVTAGAGIGSAAGLYVGEVMLERKGVRKNKAFDAAKRSFSVENIASLEDNYAKTYREYEKAGRNHKYYAMGGAALGALAGATLAGSLDNASDVVKGVPDVPSAEIPENVSETLNPEEGIDNFLQPPLESANPAPEVLNPPEGIDNFLQPALESEVAPPPAVGSESMMFQPPAPEEWGIDDGTSLASPEVITESELNRDLSEDYPFIFVEGKTDTVSEALFETWKSNPSVVDTYMSKNEFLAKMYETIAELEHDPLANRELLEQMKIHSGDIDKVQLGQTINLQPFFELMKK